MKKSKAQKKRFARWWHIFAFKHTASAITMITVFVLLLDTVIVQTMLAYIVDLGYVGLVIAGMMFVSFFTAAPGIALLLAFTEVYNPIIVSVVAGCGAAAGDFIILRYVEDRVGRELKPIAQRLQLMAFVD